MQYKIIIDKRAASYFKKLPENIRNRIKNKLLILKTNPRAGERLVGFNYRKIRVGDYRIIYEIWEKEKTIVLIFAGHRRNVYDDLRKLF